MMCKALHRLIESVKEKGTWVFWALEQLQGSFTDIGSHQEFQKPEFVMPELLLEELWTLISLISSPGSTLRRF